MVEEEGNYKKLVEKLEEIFQIKKENLDFGIYRILNQKSREIERFLEEELEVTVKKNLGKLASKEVEKKKEKLEELGKILQDSGIKDFNTSEKYVELKAEIQAFKTVGNEDTIYLHLLTFFKNYYEEGDFISQRRYGKKDAYALPYNGEEVKLHWANADQYYIKSGENFQKYEVKLDEKGKKKLRFELVSGSLENNNNKGGNKVFILAKKAYKLVENSEIGEEKVALKTVEKVEEEGIKTLIIRFEYKVVEKAKQKDKITETLEYLNKHHLQELVDFGLESYYGKDQGKDKKERTILEKHLNDYVAKNSFDYFIHKSLSTFLSQELEVYIKNQILSLDKVLNEGEVLRLDTILIAKSVREIAGKIIRFLGNLEDFQRKLWEKKKFVLRTNYCLTLDKIQRNEEIWEEIWPKIVQNKEQIAEWKAYFKIDKIAEDLSKTGYSEPLKERFLLENEHLVLDTKYFSKAEKWKILSVFPDLEAETDGTLLESENFGALNLLQAKYREKIKCIYIDPPYNTGGDGFVYKDNYQSSSWLSMMENRVELGRELLSEEGVQFVSIDDHEQVNLNILLGKVFGSGNFIRNIVWLKGNAQNDADNIQKNHEYIMCYAKNVERVKIHEIVNNTVIIHEDEHGFYYIGSGITTGGAGGTLNARPNLGFTIYYNYKTMEKIGLQDYDINLAKHSNDELKVYTTNQKLIKEGFVPIRPPKKGNMLGSWSHSLEKFNEDKHLYDISEKGSVRKKEYISSEHIGKNNTVIIKKERPLKSFIQQSSSQGTILVKDIFNFKVFDNPKPTNLIKKLLQSSTQPNDIILDYFAGSGTTAHSVITLNREDKGKRKYILVEMGSYFETVTKPRIKKVIYSSSWKNGIPEHNQGSSHLCKYLQLESYEDSLNNLKFTQNLPDFNGYNDLFPQEYISQQMLYTETQNSPSLLNLDQFSNPFSYKMEIFRNDQKQILNVDLVETFNYLMGFHVKCFTTKAKLLIVEAITKNHEFVLCLWRNLSEINDETLFEILNQYSPKIPEISTIYLNGDCTFGNISYKGKAVKITMIEPIFKELMFSRM